MAVIRWLLVSFSMLALLGCSSPPTEPTYADVEGTVTLDSGAKLADGEIVFEDRASGRVPTTLPIKDGKYQGKVPVGKLRVSIFSYKDFVVPKGQPGEGSQSRENILHAKHGPQSQETRDVTADGPNKFDFKVSKAN
jgi:hypothetical protein